MSEREGPGGVLRAEREALGVTIREVAETLNLSMSTIEAIETNDYERLPGPVFARGYVRAYARLLNLAPESLVARYPQQVPVPDVVESNEPPVWEWIRRRPGLVLGSAAGLVLLLAVLLAALLWPEAKSPGMTADAEPGLGDPMDVATTRPPGR